jgi:hypothetical protein
VLTAICAFTLLHLRAPLNNKTSTGRVNGLHPRGSEGELPVFETGMRKWCGCRAVNKFCVLLAI